MSCPHCERKRKQQLAMFKAWKQGKEYAQTNGLDRFVLCIILASLKEPTKRYSYCEVGDSRLGTELKEIETIFLT